MFESKRAKWIVILAAIGFQAVFFFLVLRDGQQLFQFNDDLFMRDIASGAYSGMPDGHLVFIQYALGALIAGLYTLTATIPWYTVFLCVSMAAALCAVLIRLLLCAKNWMMLVVNGVVYALLLVLVYKNLYLLQFTVAAALCGVCALVWFVTMRTERTRGQAVADTVVITAFLLLCFCWRAEIFLMAGACIFAAFVVFCIRGKKAYLRRMLPLILAVAVGCAGIFLVEKVFYRGYEDYRAYSKARSQLYDYKGVPDYAIYKYAYDRAGIGEAEYLCLMDYTTEVGDMINTQSLQALTEELPDTPAAPITSMFFDGNFLDGLTRIVILLFALGALACVRDLKRLSWFAICHGMLFALIAYTLMQGRVVERVSVSVLLLSASISIGTVCTGDFWRKERGSIERAILRVAAVACCVLLVAAGVSSSQRTAGAIGIESAFFGSRANVRETVNAYCDANAQNKYYCSAGVLSNYGAYAAETDIAFSNNGFAGGWLVRSPMDAQRLAAWGMETDFAKALATQENAYFIASDGTQNGMNAFLQQNYKKQLVPVDTIVVSDVNGADFIIFTVYQAVGM